MDALAAGRELKTLGAPWAGTDALYASARVDGQTISSGEYAHSTFSNVSFLNAKLIDTKFLDCIFVNCYFRRADLRDCTFVGCRFIECNFIKTAFKGGDYSYSVFERCFAPFSEFEYALPTRPNLKQDLARNLSLAAEQLGHSDEARRYRLAALDAQKDHLLAAVRAESEWYRTHYDVIGRLYALIRLFWYYLNNILWRHGESALRLLSMAVALVFIVFPALSYLATQGAVSVPDLLWLSVANFLSIDRASDVDPLSAWVRSTSAVEALLGILFAGLYVTVLVKALLRR